MPLRQFLQTHKIKKIIILLAVFALLLLLASIIREVTEERSGTHYESSAPHSPETDSDRNTSLQNAGSSNRNEAIQKVMANPYILFEINTPKTEIKGVTYFSIGHREELRPESSQRSKPGGILVFKVENEKPILFWESREQMSVGWPANFRDINHDGISELVWEDPYGDTKAPIYVYQFAGDHFELITPVIATTPTNVESLLLGDTDLTCVKDIDRDGIDDITVGNWDSNGDQNVEIYKYNGQRYALSEETISKAERIVQQSHWTIYRNQQYGIEFQYPEDYEVALETNCLYRNALFYIGLRPKGWTDSESYKLFSGSDYPLLISIADMDFDEAAREAGFSRENGLWTLNGRHGFQGSAREITVQNWKGLSGSSIAGSFFREGGYAGIQDFSTVMVNRDEHASVFFNTSEIWEEKIFDTLVSSFRFIE